MNRTDADYLKLSKQDVGEESLLQAIVKRSKKHPKVKHIFVTNDQKALEKASVLNLKIETITDYLNHLTDYQIIECGHALVVAEIALSEISKYRNM